ncbi:MAG TPA: cytochrome P450 [Pseudolysinimonas sp.]|nr:cytochrome P450 [Pseudolysinimonas sp.]
MAVIVPVYDEAAGIRPTLEALAAQQDADFDAVFVDNGSRDGSGDIIRSFIAQRGLTRWRVIDEPQKGTGAAADTGMRAAIAAGATLLARTDADCLPRADWTAAIRRALTPKAQGGRGLRLVGGELLARRDEGTGLATRAVLRGAVHLAEGFGRIRSGNRDPAYLGPYLMAAGCNVGITAELYLAAGGFPRTRIEDVHEDRALVNAVRRITRDYARRSDVVVYGSSRRVRAWGLKNTLLWYKDHAYRPEHVDIRSTSVDTATRWEQRVLRAAHPIAFPLLSAIRGPVRRIPGLGIVVKDAALLRATLMDTEGFTKNGPGAPSDLWTPVLGPSVLLNMEGAEHGALRRKLGPLFAPAFVDALVADSLGAATRDLADALARGDRVDLVVHSRRSASAVIARLVGLDSEVIDDDLFSRISRVTGFVTLARPRLTPSQLRLARGILAELGEHAKRAYAGDESTVPGRMRALGLDEREALGAVGAFVLTGTETIVSYVPRLAAILIDSGWLPRLSADLSLVDAAVAEGLRVTTPSPMMLRSVAQPRMLGDVAVRPGERILLGTYWANRALGEFDPATNPAAQLKQLWFGAGAHYCLGAPLAMAQIRLTLGALLETPTLRIATRRPSHGVLIPSYASLHLERA